MTFSVFIHSLCQQINGNLSQIIINFMLYFYGHSFLLKRSVKAGLYIDYLFKLISLFFLRNQFNWSSIFILEKFIIEYVSRYTLKFVLKGSQSRKNLNSINYSSIIYIILLSVLL